MMALAFEKALFSLIPHQEFLVAAVRLSLVWQAQDDFMNFLGIR
jgi:hypothetical protein